MTKRYRCFQCKELLMPVYIGAVARTFEHGLPDGCPNFGKTIERGSDQIVVSDEPVIMQVTGLSYPRAGVVKYFQCELDVTHSDYSRGEFSERPDLKPMKRCLKCDGMMIMRTVRLRLDGSVEPFVAGKRKPTNIVEIVPVLNDQQILKVLLKKLNGKYKRIKHGDKSVELIPANTAAYRQRGIVFRRTILVIADAETQSISAFLYGASGSAPDIMQAARRARIKAYTKVLPAKSEVIEPKKKIKPAK